MFFVKKWPNNCNVVINMRQEFGKKGGQKAIVYSAKHDRACPNCWYESGQNNKSRNAQAERIQNVKLD